MGLPLIKRSADETPGRSLARKGHLRRRLKDAAEKIDGEQDQDDDDEDSDDGQEELLGWVLVSWGVKGGTDL
jgi:hypothetical protein